MRAGHFNSREHDRLMGLSKIALQLEEDAVGQQDQECVALLVRTAKGLRLHQELLTIYDQAVMGQVPMERGWQALKKLHHQRDLSY